MKQPALLAFLLLSLAAPALAAPISVGGRVLDGDGRPVKGAAVRLVARVGAAERGKLELQGKTEPDAAATAASDADGGFRVSAPDAGMWRLVVEARGFVPRQYDLIPLVEDTEVPAVRLARDEGAEVRVVDAGGKPLAGVRVRAFPDRDDEARRRPGGFRFLRNDPWEPVPVRLAVTGADGKATLPRGAEEVVVASATAPGLVGIPGAKPSKPQSKGELRLVAGCERAVVVLDHQGRPVAEAVIRNGGWALAVTDEAGRGAAAASCKEKTTWAVEARDGRQTTVDLAPSPSGAAEPVRVKLGAPAASLSGRVLAADSRAPLPGALVWSMPHPSVFVRADATGGYTMPAPPPGRTLLQAAAAGYLSAAREFVSGPGPVFALAPTALVGGTVVDGAGKGVTGAELRIPSTALREGLVFEEPWTRSGPGGSFRVSVPAGTALEIHASHDRHAPARLAVAAIEPRAARTGLKVVLGSGLAVFGRVVDTRERPVAGATVSLRPVRTGDGPQRPFEIFLPNAAEDGFQGRSDAQGRFTIERLTAGRYDLEAKAAGFAPVTVPGITVEGTARFDAGTVILPEGVTLEGVVVDPQDRPIEGAWVSIMTATMRRGGSEEGVESGADGRFSVTGLRPGTFMLSASREGYVRNRMTGVKVPSEEPVRVVLEPGVKLSGRVVDEAGRAVAEARVMVFEEGRGPGRMMPGRLTGSASSDAEGHFTVENQKPGQMTVKAQARGFITAESSVEVPPGRDVEGVRLVMRTGATIVGRITGPDGSPLAGAEVQVVDTSKADTFDFMGPMSAVSDGEGNYRLEGITEGPRSVAATHDGYERAVKDLQVRAGENRLDLRLGRGQEVGGRVVDRNGQPVADARVTLFTADPFEFTSAGRDVASGADGSFVFTGVRSGSYNLRATKEGYGPGELAGEVRVANAPVHGLEIRLGSSATLRGKVVGVPFQELSGVRIMASRMDQPTPSGMRAGRVDFEGAYEVEGLGPGEWQVVAMASARMARGRVTIVEGVDATLDLEFPSGGVVLTGRIVRGGEPLDGVRVFVHGADMESSGSGVSDARGAFRIEGLTPGNYVVNLMQFETGLQHSEPVELAGDRDILIDLPTQRVSGRVVDASDSPVAGAAVTVEPATGGGPVTFSGMGQGATSGADGDFTVTGLADGSYRVSARKEGYAPAETTIEVRGGDVDGVRLALGEGAGLVLEVRSFAGTPPARVEVALLDPAGRAVLSGSYNTGENGRVRLTEAPAGRWRLLAGASGSATVALDVSVPSPPLPIALPPAAQLTVTVPELAGGPGATLSIIGSDGQPFRAVAFGFVQSEWPMLRGSAQIGNLPPGAWRLKVTAPDGQVWEGTASTTAGGTHRVVLE
jgi:protocatechuate 3,4-dioxygenase beta subunit